MPNSNTQTRKSGQLKAYFRLAQVIILVSMMLTMMLTGCGLKGDLTLEPRTPSQQSQNKSDTNDDDDV